MESAMPRRTWKQEHEAPHPNQNSPPQQHFLNDATIARRVVSHAHLRPSDLVVEFGAGGGALTTYLAAKSRRVIAVERDPRLARRLGKRLRRHSNVEVIEGDALDVPLPGKSFKVVANIPFGITSPLLRRLLEGPDTPPERVCLILQWEAARKLARRTPASLKTLSWSPWYELSVPMRLPATVFSPPPKATAGLLVAAKRGPPLVPAAERSLFHALTTLGFTGRGGTVGKNLRPVLTGPQIRRLARDNGFDPNALPSDLDVQQWTAVFDYMKSAVPGSRWPKPRAALRKRKKLTQESQARRNGGKPV
jgi:23S rRNA (adenine-N6)-dimethyltransferase